MKIGLSYSRCVRDIVEGLVDIDDVLVVIARTDFDPRDDDQWIGIWEYYAQTEWRGHGAEKEQEFRDISIDLLTEGKLHQPRQFGSRPIRRREIWLETVLPNSELESNPAARAAWDHFQTIAGLTNVKLDKDYQ